MSDFGEPMDLMEFSEAGDFADFEGDFDSGFTFEGEEPYEAAYESEHFDGPTHPDDGTSSPYEGPPMGDPEGRDGGEDRLPGGIVGGRGRDPWNTGRSGSPSGSSSSSSGLSSQQARQNLQQQQRGLPTQQQLAEMVRRGMVPGVTAQRPTANRPGYDLFPRTTRGLPGRYPVTSSNGLIGETRRDTTPSRIFGNTGETGGVSNKTLLLAGGAIAIAFFLTR